MAVKIDEVYVKGKWGSRVAIADSFRSDKGRVFLAGDSGEFAHMQLRDKKTDWGQHTNSLPLAGMV